jgi:hypothetical protein
MRSKSYILVESIKEGNDHLKMSRPHLLCICSGGSGLNVLEPDSNRLFDQIARNATKAGAVNSSEETESRRVVVLYRNGFTVDDGTLRDFTSPENVQFIRSIERGEVPRGKKV